MGTPSHQLSVAGVSDRPDRSAPLLVRPFEASITPQWNEFVMSQPRGTLFHLTGWKDVLEKTFGYEPCYLFAERAGRVTGVAPLFWVSNWVMGKCLVSVPLAAYGGICAEDPESEQALLVHMRQLAEEHGVDFLELRNRNGGLLPDFQPNPRYATFPVALSADHAENLKRLPRDTRYMIRKGEKAGLQSRTGLGRLGEFYGLLAANYHRLGTPVFPSALFENLEIGRAHV